MELTLLREEINRIDREIISLLNERMELALRTTKLKEKITDEKREQCVINTVKTYCHDLIDDEFASQIFKKIIAESKKLQREKHALIGFQGEHGAYGEMAAKRYSEKMVPIPCTAFAEIFEAVEHGWFDLGIVPIENSIEGTVTEVTDLLIAYELPIVGEIQLPVHHALLAPPSTELSEIKKVYSHPQALAQCRSFLTETGIEIVPYYDTAGAARMIADTFPPATAAIASTLCAERYNLEIIKRNVGDVSSNFTRFVVVSSAPCGKGTKCSIVVSVKHEPGALHRLLRIFTEKNINLTRIISRPIKERPGHYMFLLDFQGSVEEERIKEMLREMKDRTLIYKFLGCYPEAIL